jgi:cytoskeletal protein RodZ
MDNLSATTAGLALCIVVLVAISWVSARNARKRRETEFKPARAKPAQRSVSETTLSAQPADAASGASPALKPAASAAKPKIRGGAKNSAKPKSHAGNTAAAKRSLKPASANAAAKSKAAAGKPPTVKRRASAKTRRSGSTRARPRAAR